jgi:hypothetical protein
MSDFPKMEYMPLDEEGPEAESALALMQSIYRDPRVPLPVRMRAASECLPFETPKLGAVAVTSLTANDFAAALDRAIARSGKAPLSNRGQGGARGRLKPMREVLFACWCLTH